MIEGRLTIDLHPRTGAAGRVEIASSRPQGIARMFRGKTPDDVARDLPVLFSICAVAQGRAAGLALGRAAQVPHCPVTEAARDCLVWMETAREHLLAIALSWTRLLGLEPETARLQTVTRLLPELRAALFGEAPAFDLDARAAVDMDRVDAVINALTEQVAEVATGMQPAAFRALATPAEFRTWAMATETVAARLTRRVIDRGWSGAGDGGHAFLPAIDDAALLDRLMAEDGVAFAARPEWADEPKETTSLSRRRDDPLIQALIDQGGACLLTRFAARLKDLARLPADLHQRRPGLDGPTAPVTTARGNNGRGLAQVEAARGRLVHGVRLTQGRVTDYRILAPTEWNFHPGGAAARSLAALTPAGGDMTDQAHLMIGLIDPCVAYDLRVH